VRFLAQQDWWAAAAVAAGAVAVLLMGLYFNPWLLAGILISAAILYAGVHALQQS
jgi:divalent metal cation (Fe/Co/Zn/Cd) transporter